MTNLDNLSENSNIATGQLPTREKNDENSDFDERDSKHNSRLNRLSAHKKRTVSISNYLKEKDKIDNNFYNRVHSCYDYLLFNNYQNLKKIKLRATKSCQVHLLCPMCAIVRAAKQVQVYEAKYQELKRKNPKLSLYYLVLTVKNGKDLSVVYEHLHKSIKKLIERRREAKKAKSGKKSSNYALNSVFANVLAGAYSIEVKKGENSKQWHPHVNFLLLSEDRIFEHKIKSEWKSITKDSSIVSCDVKDDGDKTVFVEIFKYALKFSEMEFDDNFTAWQVLKGRRLTGSFGEFWGLDIEKEDTEIALQDEPYIELFYKYQRDISKYELHRKT